MPLRTPIDRFSSWQLVTAAAICGLAPFWPNNAHPQGPTLTIPTIIAERVVGPYDVHVLQGGSGLTKVVPPTSHTLEADGVYTFSAWVQMSDLVPATTLIAGVGDPEAENSRYLGLRGGRPIVRFGRGQELAGPAPLPTTGWHHLAVTFDGTRAHLFADGVEVASGAPPLARVKPMIVIAPAPATLAEEGFQHPGGLVAGVTLSPSALTPELLKRAAAVAPAEAGLRLEEASKPWPVQTRGQAGYLAPQDPELMPQSRVPLPRGVAKPLPPLAASALVQQDEHTWVLAHNWWLTPAPAVAGDGATLSNSTVDVSRWMRATLPGTVLTTMVDRGLYPDPDFGLNNLAIPESLNRQDYWYRVEFPTPAEAKQHHAQLVFNGINYAAEVWLNGHALGDVKGAFLRGAFDVTPYLAAGGKNTLAVKIQPPPHPGIPQEQSIKGGPGENGGAMVLDGPTFMATEGWDWIPAVRDRNSGIWQDVLLQVSDEVRLGDAQVVTHLPLPDTSSADVEITVPVRNQSAQPVQATIRAQFEGTSVSKQVTLSPGTSIVKLTRAEFPQLHVEHPRLWWPNGYGKPELYHLKLSAAVGSRDSDGKTLTFGIREITYNLSLFDRKGRLQRVEVSPTEARALGKQVVDVRHEAMRNREAEFASASLTAEGEHSPAVRPVTDEPGMTDLVLKVNGVRIAARGGNWGMDDSRKRVSREHLEPYFRLHREANLNMIRNWVGQDTEETFYQLADEYGMMVWNDFWASTQDYNVEPQDVPLFLNNARDVVARFRNHPSIVIWCGRNEGVPQPILNEGLDALLREEDGTRYYNPDSNRVNLRNSGPYYFQEPESYYTKWGRGFSVEMGIPSPSTLEALQAQMAPADQWPISDAWAYHDWHQSGNGKVEPFMQAIETEFGAATDLKDFERKAQMLSYTEHRAVFEGFNQHLWQPNSGRLLWMTQPAWPSNMWQIFNSDYDTPGSFYGVKKSSEPLHVQLDLSDFSVAAVNSSGTDGGQVTVRATVYSLENQQLLTRDATLSLTANRTQAAFPLALAPLFAQHGVVLVKLAMQDADGKLLSDNLYWLAGQEKEYRRMNAMAPVKLRASAVAHTDAGESVIDLTLSNDSKTAALATKAVLLEGASNRRILPAYFSDNYVSILPGETRVVTVRYPVAAGQGQPHVDLRGWNVEPVTVPVGGKVR